MSIQPASNSGHATALISKDRRFRFTLYFISSTILAALLSVYPVSVLSNLLSDIYPSNIVQPNLPNPIGFLDTLHELGTAEIDQGWIRYYGLLHSVATQTILGAFTGVFQWVASLPEIS